MGQQHVGWLARALGQSSEEMAAGIRHCEEFTWSLSRPCVQVIWHMRIRRKVFYPI